MFESTDPLAKIPAKKKSDADVHASIVEYLQSEEYRKGAPARAARRYEIQRRIFEAREKELAEIAKDTTLYTG